MNFLTRHLFVKSSPISKQFVRGLKPKAKPTHKGVRPEFAKNLDTLLKELKDKDKKDESIHFLVDIGKPFARRPDKEEVARRYQVYMDNKNDKALEKEARIDQLRIPIDDCHEEWLFTEGPRYIRRIAEHYSIFEHLFGEAYFYPITPLSISFKVEEDKFAPVYFGNTIRPREAVSQPTVDIGDRKEKFHTLVLSNLDGHLNQEDGEYVHWFVGNIPNGDVSKGETIVPYLQPFPVLGTGYHRYVFVLYEHDTKMDYSEVLKQPIKLNDPQSRTFATYDFYQPRQDDITPTGLAFFQTEYDSSVQKVFHEIFKMDEPRFEYDFPEPWLFPQQWFPHRKAFDTYMDLHRDPKQISKEVLQEKLKGHHPFKAPDPRLKYPAAHIPHEHGDDATWIQVRLKKRAFGWGKEYNDNIDIIDPK